MNLFRPAQKDLTISCAEHLLSPDDPRILSQILTSIAAGSTVRRFKFGNLPGEPFCTPTHSKQQSTKPNQIFIDSKHSSLDSLYYMTGTLDFVRTPQRLQLT